MTTEEYQALIDKRLDALFGLEDAQPALREAMRYSVTAGGKRIRPMLCLMANEACGGDHRECLDLACGIELIHTYSLVHDDLPAMDDDELRRGRPTSHVMFGEAFAILAGDGLLSYAFEIMLQNALRYPSRALTHLKAMSVVAAGAGASGMVTGQAADIENAGQVLTENELRFVHAHKTGDMITASLVSGAVLGGADEEIAAAVRSYGEHVGVAFQIVDDILDIEGSAEELGKTPGKDAKAKKFTFPTLFGVDASRRMAEENTQAAEDALAPLGKDGAALRGFAREMLERRR